MLKVYKKNKNLLERGFTLIELLVVISIIGLLSSIVLASLSTAKIKAQNAANMQLVNQLKIAINLYINDNGHAPDLGGACSIDKTITNPNTCIAVQSGIQNIGFFTTKTVFASDETKAAWLSFAQDMAPYIKNIPDYPSGSSPIEGVGYKYVAPAALKYECTKHPGLCNSIPTGNSYQISAPLKNSTVSSYLYSTDPINEINPTSPIIGSY